MELSTRERIVELLQTNPNLTAADMSRRLRVTRHDIRYHLNFLLTQGLVIKMQPAPTTGSHSPGRPAMVYQLSPTARPDNTAHLAGILLDIGQEISPPQSFFQQLAFRLIPVKLPQTSQMHFSQQLNTSIQLINQYPYQARWEAHSTGPQVIFGNCPFAAIIEKHPELCQVDRYIIENLTGFHAGQTHRINLNNPVAPVCVFRLTQPVLQVN